MRNIEIPRANAAAPKGIATVRRRRDSSFLEKLAALAAMDVANTL